MTILFTDRLRLRELTMNDVENLAGIFTDPEAMKYYPSTKNREETEGWIRWNLDGYARNGHGMWAAEFKETGNFAGQCGLIIQEVDGNREVELGYLFLREHWCRGLATEAAIACRDHAFQTVGRNAGYLAHHSRQHRLHPGCRESGVEVRL